MSPLRKFIRTIHREAALASLRNILAVIGVGTILADLSTMKYWFVIPGIALLAAMWYADYRRHFDGESIEESCVRQLKEAL